MKNLYHSRDNRVFAGVGVRLLVSLFIGCCLSLFCGCSDEVAVDDQPEVAATCSQQLLFAVLNASFSGTGWLYDEAQEVAFADLPAEFKLAYDTSKFREYRGEEAEKASKTAVIRYDINRDGSEEYFVYNGFSGASDMGWMIFTKKGKKWEKIEEEYGELKKMTHPKEKGLIISSRNGFHYRDYHYYELEKGVLVNKLNVEREIIDSQKREALPVKISYKVSKDAVAHDDVAMRLEKAAKEGDALAQNILGHCYLCGDDAHSKSEAVKWLRKAAAQGNTEARKSLQELGGK